MLMSDLDFGIAGWDVLKSPVCFVSETACAKELCLNSFSLIYQ